MKVGVAIITCNRERMLQKLLNSLPFNTSYNELVIVDDSADSSYICYDSIEVLHTRGQGVGVAKNAALNNLLAKGCDYIFLIEDDMLIKRADIFDAYISASKKTGIQHFMFAYHGPANKNNVSGGPPNPRVVVEYPGGVRIALNQHCVGAFCMYTKESLEKVGLMDDVYKNVWEHIDHSYRLVQHGYAPAYWWWPDLANSMDYITEQACSEQSSVIRNREDWRSNIEKGTKHFTLKHGVSPVSIPDKSFNEVREKLKGVYKYNV